MRKLGAKACPDLRKNEFLFNADNCWSFCHILHPRFYLTSRKSRDEVEKKQGAITGRTKPFAQKKLKFQAKKKGEKSDFKEAFCEYGFELEPDLRRTVEKF